ncbi:sigma-70 family RNA polymerase sigma factor [Methylomonas sp. EFPC1]|uniref:Sigma-70 family RNA polymerase sigma factor n=1 Tax=Methylomonas defluvii TaxID=3045149 RepID=A0ABU4UD48_9GAMM|nr:MULTISPECIES: sigma-70 family RNA polymerase sigma factor [unclassified Methylomonas]MDX8127353.1 sigma-70 family RNA polymerase sigma factor [Methylomonas sp. OY6]QSB02315.1 sigma-70 family RNA polymerase sigma factor [Methylomonas sp. EFPC1]
MLNDHYPPLTAAYLRHQAELQQFLLRQVNCREAAADLLQDTFLHIAEYAGQDAIANCRAFLYRVAGNLALDYLRSQARQQARDGGALDQDWQCPCPLPERMVQGEQQWLAAESWLRGLPALNRQIWCLRRLDGKRHQHIAAELQISERQVERVLYQTGRMLAGANLDDA